MEKNESSYGRGMLLFGVVSIVAIIITVILTECVFDPSEYINSS